MKLSDALRIDTGVVGGFTRESVGVSAAAVMDRVRWPTATPTAISNNANAISTHYPESGNPLGNPPQSVLNADLTH